MFSLLPLHGPSANLTSRSNHPNFRASETGQQKRRNYFFFPFLFNYSFANISFFENNFLVVKEKHKAYFLTMSKYGRISFHQHALKKQHLQRLMIPKKRATHWIQPERGLKGSLESARSWAINHNTGQNRKFQTGSKFQRVRWYHFKMFHLSKRK